MFKVDSYRLGSGLMPTYIAGRDEDINNKKVKTILPTRAQLINKGIIFPVRHSELDFTVPEFARTGKT